MSQYQHQHYCLLMTNAHQQHVVINIIQNLFSNVLHDLLHPLPQNKGWTRAFSVVRCTTTDSGGGYYFITPW